MLLWYIVTINHGKNGKEKGEGEICTNRLLLNSSCLSLDFHLRFSLAVISRALHLA